MAIHVSKDTGCNLSCSYCYEEEDRDINGNSVGSQSLDTDEIIDQLEHFKEERPDLIPGLHGGEPLLVDIEDLRTVFQWVYENYEEVREGEENSHIQTNGTLLTDEHVEMFKEYNVHVGISCDGPPELNRERQSRGAQGQDVTDEMSRRTEGHIKELAEEDGVSVGIIVVPNETNAGADERLETLLDWMDDLAQVGVMGHYNAAIPYDEIQTEVSLSPERLKEVYLRTWEWVKAEPYREWNPMSDYRDNLLGNKLTNCVNDRCDPFNAGAARIVKGNAETTGCGKTWSAVGDGVPFLQGPSNDSEYDANDERYEMLKQVPGPYTEDEPDMGGCKGCRYWNVCQGGCPSAAMDQDFRKRTRWCEAKYALYEQIERDMRAIYPNQTLITDYPWNAPLAKYATRWQLDIKPFAGMRPGEEGSSSVWGSAETDAPGPIDRLPDGAMPDDIDEEIDFIKEIYPDEHVTYDREEGTWHADSAMEPQQTNDTGWRREDDA